MAVNPTDKPMPDLFPDLGLEAGRVTLSPYCDSWPASFAHEAARIQQACGDAIACVEHVGSTAVPGLTAKPVLDISPGLRSFEAGKQTIEPMQRLGYIYRGEYGIPGRHFFLLDHPAGNGLRVVHCHMFVIDSHEWWRHITFRDALRGDADQRRAYQSLKEQLAAAHPDNRDAYTDAKSAFIEDVLARARSEDEPRMDTDSRG